MQLDLKELNRIIENALREDIGKGDITTNLVISKKFNMTANFVARENCVVCGLEVLENIFARSSGKVKFKKLVKEGSLVKANTKIFEISGDAKFILSHERVALNLLQRMCGVASLAKKYVDEVKGTKAKILDTRKTMPGLRMLDKYAVFVGGGVNHRYCLDDAILIKDNHIAMVGDIAKTIQLAKKNNKNKLKLEVECDNLNQLKAALAVGVDVLLLDNMNNLQLKKAIEIRNKIAKNIKLEASGGVNFKTVKAIAKTGVDYISVGALTHSAPNIDIGLDFI
jgi:nicotinate-nucleotide pyrophosphorylase (carboxylating)